MGARDDAYARHIFPLVHQIMGICQKHDIPFLASFHLDDVEHYESDRHRPQTKRLKLDGCFDQVSFGRVYFSHKKKLSVKVALPERGGGIMDDRDETMSGSDALRLVIEAGVRAARHAWTDPEKNPHMIPGWSGWVSYLRASDFPGLTEKSGVTCSFPVGITDFGRTEHKELALPSMYYVATGPAQNANEARILSYVTFGWKPEMEDIIATDWYVLAEEAAK